MMDALCRRVAKFVFRKGKVDTGENEENECSPPSAHLKSHDTECKTIQDMTIRPRTHLDSSSPLSPPQADKICGVESMAELEFLNTGEVSLNAPFFLAQQVFQNDLIFAKILQFLMGKDDNLKRRIKTLNSCKLVQRLWLERINCALQKSPPKWFKIHLNSLIGPKRTKKFIETFANSPSIRIPPFTLTFWLNVRRSGAFRESIYSSLLYSIEQCGAGLVELNLHVDSRKGRLYPQLPQAILHRINVVAMRLPKLESLTVYISSDSATIPKNLYEQINVLLHPVLTGCESLKTFSLLVSAPTLPNEFILPVTSEIFKLPPTLTAVNVQFALRR